MTIALRVNARNDLHLPAELLRGLNLGAERVVTAELRGNTLILVPVDLEPRYSAEDLVRLDHLHEREKAKGWIPLKTDADIDRLLK